MGSRLVRGSVCNEHPDLLPFASVWSCLFLVKVCCTSRYNTPGNFCLRAAIHSYADCWNVVGNVHTRYRTLASKSAELIV